MRDFRTLHCVWTHEQQLKQTEQVKLLVTYYSHITGLYKS